MKLQLAAAVTEINDGVVLSLRSGDWWREPPRAAGRPQSIRLDIGIQLDIGTQLDIGIRLDIGIQFDQVGQLDSLGGVDVNQATSPGVRMNV